MTKPALSAEEWAAKAWQRRDGVCPSIVPNGAVNLDGLLVSGEERHAVAALCLHGQPFGFTRERLRLMRDLHVALDRFDTGWIYNEGVDAIAALGEDLDRIEALLPPEGA